MNNKHFKAILTGSMATAVLAAGIVLPQAGKAEAAAAPSNNWHKQAQQVWIQWSWNGSFGNLDWYKLLQPTPGEQTWTPEKPQTEAPSAPNQKPTAPSQKPSAGTDGSAGKDAAAKPTAPATPTAPAAPSKENGSTAGQTDAASFAAQVVDLVNKERSKAGLKPLATQANLTKVAAAKAADMRQNGYFDHQSPTYGSPFDMMKQFGVTYSYAGENIAKGQRTPSEVMNAWMNSEGHRQNIMNANFTHIGVAYDNGYWVQEFIGK